jgi:hypothetical protein
MDQVTGVEQTFDHYWNQIHDHYIEAIEKIKIKGKKKKKLAVPQTQLKFTGESSKQKR